MEKAVKLFKDVRFIAIVILALIAVSLLLSMQMHSIEPFEIEDKCGLLLNLESHTIENEDTCKSRCRTQCVSKDFDYKKSTFEGADVGCHTCVCYCK